MITNCMLRRFVNRTRIFYPIVIQNNIAVIKPIRDSIHHNNSIIKNIDNELINDLTNKINKKTYDQFYYDNYVKNIYGKLYFEDISNYDLEYTHIPIDIDNIAYINLNKDEMMSKIVLTNVINQKSNSR